MKDLTKGNITKTLLTLALPLIGTSFMQFANNIIDMFWVGKLGSDEVAAVGVSGFYLHLVWAISSIITVGAGIMISHARGVANERKAQTIGWHALLTSWLLAIIFGALLLNSSDWLGQFFNLTGPSFGQYFKWVALGLLFANTTNMLTSISMASGDTQTPFRLRAIGIGMNLVLNPVLIFSLNMGIEGAGLSTFIAQFTVALIFFIRKRRSFVGYWGQFSLNIYRVIPMIKLGISPSVQRMIFSLASIVIGKIVAEWGEHAIAAQKIGHQVEALAFMTMGGLAGSIMTFTGQNFGANKIDRVKESYKVALKMAILFGAGITVLLYTQAESLVRIFVTETETVAIGVRYLQIISLSQVFACVEMLTSSFINGLGKTVMPARINIIILLSRIPLALYLSTPERLGLDGIWWTIFITTVIRGISMLVLYDRTMSQFKSDKKQLVTT